MAASSPSTAPSISTVAITARIHQRLTDAASATGSNSARQGKSDAAKLLGHLRADKLERRRGADHHFELGDHAVLVKGELVDPLDLLPVYRGCEFEDRYPVVRVLELRSDAGRIITLSSVIMPSSSKVSLSIPSICFPSTVVANSRIATRSCGSSSSDLTRGGSSL